MTINLALFGFCCGLLLAAFVQGREDEKHIQRGWMEHKGAIYLLTPAKPVPAP